ILTGFVETNLAATLGSKKRERGRQVAPRVVTRIKEPIRSNFGTKYRNPADSIELAVMPVLVGDGIPFPGAGAAQARLKLTHSETRPSGIVRLQYDNRR